jgi:hypothetical protein
MTLNSSRILIMLVIYPFPDTIFSSTHYHHRHHVLHIYDSKVASNPISFFKSQASDGNKCVLIHGHGLSVTTSLASSSFLLREYLDVGHVCKRACKSMCSVE